MQTNYQLSLPRPLIQLTQANMALLSSAQTLSSPAEWLQGLTWNYAAFVTELSRGQLSTFAGIRTGFVTLAQEL